MRVSQVVKLTIERFDLEEKEETYGICYDYVQFREKDGSEITGIESKYCGTNIPKEIITTGT